MMYVIGNRQPRQQEPVCESCPVINNANSPGETLMCQRCNDAAAHNFCQCTVADMWKQPLALSINDLFMPARSEGDRQTGGS